MAGLTWLEHNVTNLTKFDQALVKYHVSTCRILFGKGTAVSSRKTAQIPIQFGDLKCFLRVEIIPGFLPLLLSIKSKKAADISLHLKDGFLPIGDDLSRIHFETVSSVHLLPMLNLKHLDVTQQLRLSTQ